LREEVRHADLGDQRLNRRLEKIVDELGANPNLSIPAATDRRAEMEAAYRFFDNEKVTPQKILQPHINATHERIAKQDVVLLVQDTSELDLTRPNQQVLGAGPMDSDARRGAFLHCLLAFDTNGLALGTVWQKTWARERIATAKSASQKARRRQTTPIEQKESLRWVEGIRATRHVAAMCPDTTCVCIGDSEADIYELFSEPRAQATDDGSAPALQLIIRAGQTRCTQTGNWLDDARATECLERTSITVSARQAKVSVTKSKRDQSRDARLTEVEIRATTVTLRPPDRFDRKLPPLTINVVLVEEPDPPAGCAPIQWLLATTLPLNTLEDVRRVIQYYCRRWQVEIFFRVLKTGCRVERRLFEKLPRTLNCVAVYSIIAWRVMYLCYLSRECPDLDCEVVFSASEWKSVYSIVHRNASLPKKPPRLREVVRMIATLGGYVDRPTTEPGTQTLWIGLQRVHCYAMAWDHFGPES
jgi:hypothetical protein